MKFSYRALEENFAEPLPPVATVAAALLDHAFEIETVEAKGTDWELDVKVLPDRTADAKSVLGLARELAAVLNRPLKADLTLSPTSETARAKIIFTAEDITHLLGVALGEHEITDYLQRVRVVVREVGEGDKLIALIPADRLDLNLKEDLADEVARLYGYDRIPAKTLAALSEAPQHQSDFVLANKVREKLLSEGYTEIYGYTFTDHGEVAVEKPLASDKGWLRTNLKEGVEKAVKFNLDYLLFDKDEVKLFEIGTVFLVDREIIHVCVGAGTKKPKFKIEVVERPLSELAEEVKDLSGNLSPFIKTEIKYQPVSPYPRIVRDIAVWVPALLPVETVQDLIKISAGELLTEGPALFDEFKKADRKSLAFRLIFQAPDKTLVDSEVNDLVAIVMTALEQQGWEVRK